MQAKCVLFYKRDLPHSPLKMKVFLVGLIEKISFHMSEKRILILKTEFHPKLNLTTFTIPERRKSHEILSIGIFEKFF